MGIIVERFHCLGKYPFLRHSYISVKKMGKRLKIFKSLSLFKLSSPGSLLGSNFSNTASISSFVEFFVINCVKRFYCQLSDEFMMCTVATLAVSEYEIVHHVFHCAHYVRLIDSILGFEI